jgi:hypothetical protein
MLFLQGMRSQRPLDRSWVGPSAELNILKKRTIYLPYQEFNPYLSVLLIISPVLRTDIFVDQGI